MFDSPLVAFLTFLSIIGWVGAQVSAPNCSDSRYVWSYNSLGQGPCLVMAYLAAACNNGTFTITPLLPQHSYNGPGGSDDGDACKCNTVVYNLISACDACQGESWISYSQWSHNCTSVAVAGTFPEPISAGTRVPYWAYVNPTVSDYWNASVAQAVGDSPEVTGSASIVPSSTPASQSTITPKTAAPVPSSSKGSSNTGAIAGGVVGGIVGVALIAGFVTWFTIRRRRARSAPPAEYFSGQGSDMGLPPYPPGIERPKLYDPSDPSTYPMHPASLTIHATEPSKQFSGSSLDSPSNRKAYSGLPEI